MKKNTDQLALLAIASLIFAPTCFFIGVSLGVELEFIAAIAGITLLIVGGSLPEHPSIGLIPVFTAFAAVSATSISTISLGLPVIALMALGISTIVTILLITTKTGDTLGLGKTIVISLTQCVSIVGSTYYCIKLSNFYASMAFVVIGASVLLLILLTRKITQVVAEMLKTA